MAISDDERRIRQVAESIRAGMTRPWTLMFASDHHDEAVRRFVDSELLPAELSLVHGPGRTEELLPIDRYEFALELAARPEVTFTCSSKLLRFPGCKRDLAAAKAAGADIRELDSPFSALILAKDMPKRQLIHFATGFEPAMPASAIAVCEAHRLGLENFSVLVSHALSAPLLGAVLSEGERRPDGVLASGDVCTIMGTYEYRLLANRHRLPIVVAGPEPLDLLEAVRMCVAQLEQGKHEVENEFSRSVRAAGDENALNLIRGVFEVVERSWREIGDVDRSGLRLRRAFAAMDADRKFESELP